MLLPLTSKASRDINTDKPVAGISVDEQQVAVREALNLYKQCGINASKAWVYCDDMGEDYAVKLRDHCEANLNKINAEMEALMDEAEHLCRTLPQRSLKQWVQNRTSLDKIEPGKLREKILEGRELHEQLNDAYKMSNSQPINHVYTARNFAPYKDMWEASDRLIDPDCGESDVMSRLGGDVFLTRTALIDLDPISKLPYVKVVRAKCGHHFSMEPLLNWLRTDETQIYGREGVKECPQCKKNIHERDLVRDEEWEARVKESARRAQATQRRNAETIE